MGRPTVLSGILGWTPALGNGGFFFFIFFKIKISKIYVRFEIFQKYPRSPPRGRQALSVIFFVQIRNEVPEKKTLRATGACRPALGRQGPVASWGDDRAFFSRDLIANLKKKITLKACRPMGGDRGYF